MLTTELQESKRHLLSALADDCPCELCATVKELINKATTAVASRIGTHFYLAAEKMVGIEALEAELKEPWDSDSLLAAVVKIARTQ